MSVEERALMLAKALHAFGTDLDLCVDVVTRKPEGFVSRAKPKRRELAARGSVPRFVDTPPPGLD